MRARADLVKGRGKQDDSKNKMQMAGQRQEADHLAAEAVRRGVWSNTLQRPLCCMFLLNDLLVNFLLIDLLINITTIDRSNTLQRPLAYEHGLPTSPFPDAIGLGYAAYASVRMCAV